MNETASAPEMFAERISTIEEAYEFMLAYAAQGHQRNAEGDHIRDYLKRADAALAGIGTVALTQVAARGGDAEVFALFLRRSKRTP
jgi:hypothetical protein